MSQEESHRRPVSSSNDEKPRRKCDGLRYDLKLCLLESECVKKFGTIPKDCLRNPEMAQYVPDRCWSLQNAFFECKRSLIDMRYRFKGPKGY